MEMNDNTFGRGWIKEILVAGNGTITWKGSIYIYISGLFLINRRVPQMLRVGGMVSR